jgi:ascorbate PTS system EIIA or EIIAB component
MNEIIHKDRIEVRVQVKTWQDAIREAGSLLLNAESITPLYIEEMIHAVLELGPYMVLMPGFALAHAAPSPAVLKNDISLITLEKPVNFGSAENDPVRVVLCVCCTDRTTHREMLKRVALMILEEGMVEAIAEAPNVDALGKLMENY